MYCPHVQYHPGMNRGHFPSPAAVPDAWNRYPRLTERNRLYGAANYLGVDERALSIRLQQLGLLPDRLPKCPTCSTSLGCDFRGCLFLCSRCSVEWKEVTAANHVRRLERVS